MREEGEANFNNVAMPSFDIAIVFRSVGREGKLGDTVLSNKWDKFNIFASIIGV